MISPSSSKVCVIFGSTNLNNSCYGAVLWRDVKGRFFIGTDARNCTVSAKALLKKAYIMPSHLVVDGRESMRITQTGQNEMGYNQHRKI